MARKTAAATVKPRSRGQIIPRGKDTFLIRVPRPKVEGETKRLYHNETVKGTRRDAEKALTRVQRSMDTAEYVPPAKDTLKAICDTWLASKRNVSAPTRDGYRLRLEKDVYPVLGSKRIDSLTPADIERLIVSMVDKGHAPRTIRLTHIALKMALDQAVSWGLLSSNPTMKVTLPRIDRQEQKTLTRQQVGHLFSYLREHEDRFEALYVLLATTGLRPAEALALRWSDFDGTRVAINRGLFRDPDDHYRYKVGDTKTAGSRGTVVLFEAAIEALRRHREKAARRFQAHPDDLIFSTRDGGVIDLLYVRRRWALILEKAGLPKVRLYDLRHTHATHLLEAGEHPKIVQERLRHKNVQITMNTYTHVLPVMHEEAAARAEKKLKYG